MKKTVSIDMGKDVSLQCLYSQDWVYYDYGNCKRHLQMLFPYKDGMTNQDRYPLILFIPGSAWHKQEMYNDIPQYAKLSQRGYVVAALEYRESDMAVFPAQIEDVCHALEFIPSIADNFHINMDKIYLMGNSSGGHIAMLAALFGCIKQPQNDLAIWAHQLCKTMPAISGVIVESGSMELLICAKEALPPWMKVRPSAVLLGVDQIEGNEELAKRASCTEYINEEMEIPPVLLIHSECDPVVSVENSRVVYKKLTDTHHRVSYYELEGSTAHGGAVYYCDKILDIIHNFLSDT